MIYKRVTIQAFVVFAAVLVFFGSCNIIPTWNSQDDLRDLSAFASGLDAVMRTIADSNALVSAAEARTVNARPEPYNTSDNDTVTILDTPLATYIELAGGEGNNPIHVPGSSGYLLEWYGNPALNARFSMHPQDEYYLIKLSVYDTGDFLLDYVYEEYLVYKDSWDYLDSDHEKGFITYYDRMTDGSKIDHVKWEFIGDDSKVFTIDVPDIYDDIEAYTFTIRDDSVEPTMFETDTVIPAPERDSEGDFYIYKESIGNYRTTSAASRAADFRRPDYESKSFYAELEGIDIRTMAVFSLQNIAKSKGNVARTVTRSRQEYQEYNDEYVFISQQVRSLTTFSYRNSDPWQHITREIEQSFENELMKLSFTEGVYWGGSEVDGNPDRTTIMDLLQNSSGSSGYTGTMEVTWKNSSWVDTYDVTFNGKNFRIIPNRGPSKFVEGRGNTVAEISFDLAEIAAGEEFTIRLPSGSTFTGFWEFGLLTGTLSSPQGELMEIEVFGSTVLIDGELWISSQ